MSNIIIYKASAGSGKTYILVLEYIKCLLDSNFSDYFKYILVVSFTKDATNEMKERILSELYGLSMNTNDSKEFRSSLRVLWEEGGLHWDEKLISRKSKKIFKSIIQHYSWLNITTIDSFFQRIVRNLAHELGCNSYFNLEVNNQQVIREAVHSVIEKANQDSQLLEWLIKYVEHLINEGKNWRIKKSIEKFVECIYNEFFQEHKKYFPNNSLIFNQLIENQDQIQRNYEIFFKKTLQEIRVLLSEYQLNENDFILKGYPIIFFQKLVKGNYQEESKVMEKCRIDKYAWTTKNHKRREEIALLAESRLMPLLSCVFEKLRKVRTVRMVKDNLYKFGLIEKVRKEIEEQNFIQNRFLFSDTNLFLYQMIDDNDAPFIYEKIGSTIKHVMIDEFQDTSLLQWKNFNILLKEILSKNAFSLIVGDEKQSIYRWRNSDWNILKRVSKELNAEEKPLLYNWRSEKRIIDFNNSFFPFAAKRILKNTMFSIYEENKVKQKTKKNDEEGCVFIKFIEDNKEDRRYVDQMLETVLEQLKRLHNSCIPAKNICILVRKNKTINILADYLSHKRSDYPIMVKNHYLTIVSNEAFSLWSSLAVRIIIASLKMIVNYGNKLFEEQLIYLLKMGGLETREIRRDRLLSMPLFELVGYICRKFGLERLPGQSAYLFAFYDYLNQYLNDYSATIHHFLEHWEQDGKEKTIPTGMWIEGIRAMTIHKSKGLQFHTVIIPYCDWELSPEKNPLIWCKLSENVKNFSLFPITYKKEMKNTDFALEYEKETMKSCIDNLNLLYVAFTRVECNLIILTKKKKEIKEVKKVSNLLQLYVKQFDEYWDEKNCCFKVGEISLPREKEEIIMDNLLKQTPPVKEVKFSSVDFPKGKSIFKQSSQFRKFMFDKNTGIEYGKIMHNLFSQIDSLEDIEEKVSLWIIQGLIQSDEKKKYVEKIRQSIQLSGVEDWFSGNYKTYRECSIITEENGIIVSKRPDRVLIMDNKTIIIDYKFGRPHFSHEKQLRKYASLLIEMNYSNIEMYLWYVEQNRVKNIQLSRK